MKYRRNTHKKRHNKKNKRHTHKKRHLNGGSMTTSVDTNPISYREDEYKEMNELAKGGQNTNTPESQGPMTLDELNISTIGSDDNTNDNILTEYEENNISGFAQNPDEDWEEQMNLILQQNTNHLTDEDTYTDMESYPSLGSQSTSSFPSSEISTITDDTMGSDMSMGGKKKKRNTRKKRNNKGKKRYTKRHRK